MNRWFESLLSRRWLRPLRRSQYERDLRDEFEHHIEARTQDLIRAGHCPQEAASLARREFGPLETAKDYCRDHGGVRWFDEIQRNLRYSRRRFARRPVLFAAVVGTLALCLAANSLIFSVVDAVLIAELPYPEPEGLHVVFTSRSHDASLVSDYVDGETWFALEDSVESLELAVYSSAASNLNFVSRDQDGRPVATLLKQQRVGHGFFDVLGVPMARGRDFVPSEDVTGGPPVAVLSWPVWQQHFGGEDAVLGSQVTLAGKPHTVIGIAGESFASRNGAEVWVPLRPSVDGEGRGTNFQVIARTAESQARVETELSAVGRQIASDRGLETYTVSLRPLHEYETRPLRSRLLLLWIAVALVLLIGCVNVGGLLLSTSDQRLHELATRRALGGGHGALVRQLLTEASFLAACGVVLGLAMAFGGLQWLRPFLQQTIGLWQNPTLELRVLVWTLSISVVATLVFGLFPALMLSRHSASSLRSRGSSNPSSRASRSMVAAQVALGVALLLTAGLLVRTLLHLGLAESGVRQGNVLTATVSLHDDRYQTAEAVQRYFESGRRLLERDAVIERAGAFLTLPYQRGLNLGFTRDSDPEHLLTVANYVLDGSLDLLGVPLVAGRMLDQRDSSASAKVIVVNRTFAQRYFDDQALGRYVQLSGHARQIVGVVGDVRQRPSFGSFDSPLTDDMPTAYLPIGQLEAGFFSMVHTWFNPSWVVQTPADSGSVRATVSNILAGVDPLVPIASFGDLASERDRALSMERFQATLFGSLALLAAVLAAIGVAGVAVASVAARRKDLVIRQALGATKQQTLRRALEPSLLMVLLGIGAGLVLAQFARRGVEHMLHGVVFHDPISYLTAVGGVLLVALLASVLPALRVARVPLVDVLQEDG